MNKLSGRKTKKSNILLHRDGKILSDNDLVTTLNSYFTLVNADIPSLYLARVAFLDFSKKSFSSTSIEAFMPSSFGMFVHRRLTSIIRRMIFSGSLSFSEMIHRKKFVESFI